MCVVLRMDLNRVTLITRTVKNTVHVISVCLLSSLYGNGETELFLLLQKENLCTVSKSFMSL